MEVFWFIILMFILGMYVVLDGFDFGAGIVHLFYAKNEEEKKAVRNAIGPFWDANEVWLIASGGVLFFAFPTLYASAFSGFYLPLMLVLWLLIFRAIGLELRNMTQNLAWQAFWDIAFGVSSFLLSLTFGAALGNVVRGVNLGMVDSEVSLQEPHYFFLPLWNSDFNPLAHNQGVIDWFTLLLGLTAVIALTIHGANWIILKTSSTLNIRLKKSIVWLNFVLLILVVVTVLCWHYIIPNPFENLRNHYWMLLFPIISITGLIGTFFSRSFKKEGTGFLFSTMFLLGSFGTTVASVFPVLLRSTNGVNPSLTVYNAASHEYGLNVGVYWFVIAIILVAIYFFIQFRVFKGKLDDVGYGEH